MSEEDIKKLRHSFTNPFREDLPKPKINQFGHTILTDNDICELDLSEFKIEQNPDGSVSLNKPLMQNFMDTYVQQTEPESEKSEVFVNPIECDLLTKLISELDDMKEDKTKPFIKPESANIQIVQESSNVSVHYKDCLNKMCLYALPKDAKFCLKCGTAQLSQFCTECGYSFPGMEKFCPDCGMKR
jgi:RNA polymerase subunit RPABC4/transcription elongation factor Spt4